MQGYVKILQGADFKGLESTTTFIRDIHIGDWTKSSVHQPSSEAGITYQTCSQFLIDSDKERLSFDTAPAQAITEIGPTVANTLSLLFDVSYPSVYLELSHPSQVHTPGKYRRHRPLSWVYTSLIDRPAWPCRASQRSRRRWKPDVHFKRSLTHGCFYRSRRATSII